MPFMHPVIFWAGLGAASVPIVIHLLNRRRFRLREWAAMKFLLDSLRKNRRRLKMEELILLALRCLVVVMLALAAAKFSGCSAIESLPFGQAEGETSIFILDDSYSMGQRSGGGTLYSAAAADLGEQLRTLPKSAKAAILFTSNSGQEAKLAELKAIPDVQSVLAHVGDHRLSDLRADLPSALENAQKAVTGVAGPKRIYILSDFRRLDLAPPDRAQRLRKLFDEIQAAGVAIVAADYGRQTAGNLTVEQVALAPDGDSYGGIVLAGAECRVRVTVRNHSPGRMEQVRVRLLGRFGAGRDADFRAVASDETIPEIDPGQGRTCEFAIVRSQPGPALLKAELGDDELAGDNAAYLALEVRKAVRVLVVDDRKGASVPEAGESHFLRTALRPGIGSVSRCQPDVVTSRELAERDLEEYDLVALLNVGDFPTSGQTGARIECKQVGDLERYVKAGGGLAIFTGDRVDTSFYNRFLCAGGSGLCPYEIGPRQGDPRQAGTYYRMRLADDPAARTVRGNLLRFAQVGGVDLTDLIRFYAFTPARVPKSLDATRPAARPDSPGPDASGDRPIILARFSDGEASPAVVLRPFGAGKVVMYYTTANRQWTDWPAEGTDLLYVPAMNDMVRFLARQPEAGLNALAGEPFEMRIPRRLRGADARLTGLGADTPQPAAAWEKIGERLRYEKPIRAQGYAVSFQQAGLDAGTVVFARNADPAEGQLAPGGKGAIDAVIRGRYEYVARQADGGPKLLWSKPAREYWTWALAAMLALMAVETVLAQRFGHYASSGQDESAGAA